ncbi:hypothetical protein Tco_0231953 [Tanacetum coccineum]
MRRQISEDSGHVNQRAGQGQTMMTSTEVSKSPSFFRGFEKKAGRKMKLHNQHLPVLTEENRYVTKCLIKLDILLGKFAMMGIYSKVRLWTQNSETPVHPVIPAVKHPDPNRKRDIPPAGDIQTLPKSDMKTQIPLLKSLVFPVEVVQHLFCLVRSNPAGSVETEQQSIRQKDLIPAVV